LQLDLAKSQNIDTRSAPHPSAFTPDPLRIRRAYAVIRFKSASAASADVILPGLIAIMLLLHFILEIDALV